MMTLVMFPPEIEPLVEMANPLAAPVLLLKRKALRWISSGALALLLEAKMPGSTVTVCPATAASTAAWIVAYTVPLPTMCAARSWRRSRCSNDLGRRRDDDDFR